MSISPIIQTKRFGWAATLLLVTLGALLSYISGARYLAAVRAVEHTMVVESAIGGMLSLLKDAETGQRGYVLTGDENFLEPYEAARGQIPSHFASLVKVIAGDEVQAPRLETLQGLIAEKIRFIEQTIYYRRKNQAGDALALVRTGEGKQWMDLVRATTREMLDHEAQLLQRRKSDARSAEVMAALGLCGGSVVTILFALFSWATVHRDVQAMKRSTEEREASESHYRLLTEQSSDLVRLLTLDGAVSYVSPSVTRLLGYAAHEYLAISPRELLHPDELKEAVRVLKSIVDGGEREGLSTYRIRHKSGEYLWFEVRWAVRVNEQGAPIDIHTAGRDVTARIASDAQLTAYAEELRSLSLRDELTDLYNRRGFLEVGGHSHNQAIRDKRSAAVIFVDLNGMKRINDEHGHDVGDQALVDTAQVLTHCLRDADVVARLGGDEFVVFALDFAPADLDNLRKRMRFAADRVVWERNRAFRLSLSLGAAYLSIGADITIDELLEQADQAMYAQKNARRAAGNVSILPQAANGA